MVSSIVTSVSIINAGVSETFLAGLPDIQRNTVARQFDSLINAPTPFYLLSIGERLIAIVLHITLAVLVWMAVAAGGSLEQSSPHALADTGTALYQSRMVSVIVAQVWALIVTIILVLAVRKLYVSTTVPLARGGAQAS